MSRKRMRVRKRLVDQDDAEAAMYAKLSTQRQGRLAGKEFYSVRQVADALRATGGIMTRAARLLKDATGLGHYGKSDMIRRYIEKHPELQEVMRDIEERTLDLAETKLVSAIRNEHRQDHLRAVCFYLKHKGKGRGYVGRSEVTGADGVPLYPERHIDLSRLTDEELAELERLHAKAEVEGPGGEPDGSQAPVPSRGNGDARL